VGEREILLDGLVAVGDAREHDELALPAGLSSAARSSAARVALDDDLGVEIEVVVRRA